MRCSGITKKGDKCMSFCSSGLSYCRRHFDQIPKKINILDDLIAKCILEHVARCGNIETLKNTSYANKMFWKMFQKHRTELTTLYKLYAPLIDYFGRETYLNKLLRQYLNCKHLSLDIKITENALINFPIVTNSDVEHSPYIIDPYSDESGPRQIHPQIFRYVLRYDINQNRYSAARCYINISRKHTTFTFSLRKDDGTFKSSYDYIITFIFENSTIKLIIGPTRGLFEPHYYCIIKTESLSLTLQNALEIFDIVCDNIFVYYNACSENIISSAQWRAYKTCRTKLVKYFAAPDYIFV